MSYLDSASLLMIPSGYKEDKVFSQLPEDGSGDLTFTRASDGTRVNSDGLVERVPYNLLQQSNTFSNSVWNKSNTTVTSGQSGYDGLSNAWNLIPNTTNTNSHRMYIDYSSGGGVFTASIYAKANGYNFLKLNNYSASVVFDISSGTIVSESGSPIESHIESVGNGWHKISVTRDSLLGNLRTQIFVQIDAANTSFSGDGTSGVLIQDAQLNEGPTAKPYIATTNRQDVPRLDYSNGCPCLLLEPQRTNKITYSQDFSAWGMIDVSLSTGYASPDGQNNATKITKTGPNGYLVKSNSVLNNDVRSIYAKTTSGTGTLQLFTYYGNTNNYFTITEEWQRFDLNSVTTSTGELNFYAVDFRGSSTLTEVILWGAQAEAGSYPTSYIPTTSAAVTRLADAAYKTGISSLIGQTEGTLFVEFQQDYISNIYGLMSITDGTSLNRITINTVHVSPTEFTFSVAMNYAGSSTVLMASNITYFNKHKAALVYSGTIVKLFIDGVQVDTNTTTGFGNYNRLIIGQNQSGGSTNETRKFYQTTIHKTALTDTELETLTTL